VARMIYQIKLIDLATVEQQYAIYWARENCPSFRGVFIYENEYLTDDPEYYEFIFENEKDATLFGLKFGSH
jgi:hypothetical protein